MLWQVSVTTSFDLTSPSSSKNVMTFFFVPIKLFGLALNTHIIYVIAFYIRIAFDIHSVFSSFCAEIQVL